MKQEFDSMFTSAGRVVDKVAQQAVEVAQNGRGRVELYQLKRRLAKAQKQLGALVYMLHKTEQESDTMVEHYVREIDVIKAQIELHEAQQAMDNSHVQCALCGAQGMKNTLYCRRCGARLPK